MDGWMGGSKATMQATMTAASKRGHARSGARTVLQLLALHGGQLTCYSMPGKGAKFAIELPIALSRFAEPTDEEEDEAVHCVSA